MKLMKMTIMEKKTKNMTARACMTIRKKSIGKKTKTLLIILQLEIIKIKSLQM